MARRDKERVKPEVKKEVNPQESKTPMSKKWEELTPIIGKDFKSKDKKKLKTTGNSYKF
tara:strand:- start:15545 stop:15721 length:177 start_codon:yes stop_codon:yes gene_type:complete